MKSLQLTKPHVLAVVGIPGSGKTFFAEQFAKTFSAPFLDRQQIIELSSDEKTADKVWEYVLEQLFATKQTVIVETLTSTVLERRQLAATARANGYQILFIWVQTEPVTAEMRATKGAPGNKQQGRLLSQSEFGTALENFEPLTAAEKYMVISGKHTYASQAKHVLKKLVEPRVESTKTPHASERSTALPPNDPTPRPGRITIN